MQNYNKGNGKGTSGLDSNKLNPNAKYLPNDISGQQRSYAFIPTESVASENPHVFASNPEYNYMAYNAAIKDPSIQSQMRSQYPPEMAASAYPYLNHGSAFAYNSYYPGMGQSVPSISDSMRYTDPSLLAQQASFTYPYVIDPMNSIQMIPPYGMMPATTINQSKTVPLDFAMYQKQFYTPSLMKDIPSMYGNAPNMPTPNNINPSSVPASYTTGANKTLSSESYVSVPMSNIMANKVSNIVTRPTTSHPTTPHTIIGKEKPKDTKNSQTQVSQKRAADITFDKNPKQPTTSKNGKSAVEIEIATLLTSMKRNKNESATPSTTKNLPTKDYSIHNSKIIHNISLSDSIPHNSNNDNKIFTSPKLSSTHQDGSHGKGDTNKGISQDQDTISTVGIHVKEESTKGTEFKIKNDHYHESLHIHCPTCHRRNGLKSIDYPKIIKCSSCGDTFNVIKKYIHGCLPGESIDPDDTSLELPCLRRQTDPNVRSKRLIDHYNTIINGRRCEQSTRIREIQKVMTSLINKVEKCVSKEQRHIQDECTSFMNHLICSVEQYNNGTLYCKCFTPYFPQRHYIQCDVCDFWYHTSCVGIDSRKSSLIIEFVCPWCEKKTGKTTQYETPGDGLSSQRPPSQCPLCNRYFPRPCNLSRHLHARHKMKWSTHMILHMDVDNYLKQECFIPDEESKSCDKIKDCENTITSESDQSIKETYSPQQDIDMLKYDDEEEDEDGNKHTNTKLESKSEADSQDAKNANKSITTLSNHDSIEEINIQMEESPLDENNDDNDDNDDENSSDPNMEKKFPLTKSNTRYLLRKLRSKPRQWWINKTLKVYKGPIKGYMEGVVKTIRPRNEMIIRYTDGSNETLVNLYDLKYNIKLPILRGTYELELAHAIPYPIQRSTENDINVFVKSDLKYDKKAMRNEHKIASRAVSTSTFVVPVQQLTSTSGNTQELLSASQDCDTSSPFSPIPLSIQNNNPAKKGRQ